MAKKRQRQKRLQGRYWYVRHLVMIGLAGLLLGLVLLALVLLQGSSEEPAAPAQNAPPLVAGGAVVL